MKGSALMNLRGWLPLLALVWPISSMQLAQAAPPLAPLAAAVDATESLRPFDPQDFALAYGVLLGAGDLQRAFLVAQRAVQVLPNDRQWRRKLAQVSDWTKRPEVAAQQWLALFAMGDRTQDTLRAVVRLAPLADQPMLALQAWAELAKQQALTDVQWQDVFNLYEMAAEPLQGSQFFEAQFAARKNPNLLEFSARLAERAGDDDRAQRLYIQRANMQPFSMDVTLRAVVLLIRRDKMEDALALLQAHQNQVPAQAMTYWHLLGQVAWEAGAFDAAKAAYTQYVGQPEATLEDWYRLIFLVRQEHPAQAAELAFQAYKRFGAVDQLLLALGVYAELGDMAAQSRLYAELGGAATDALSKDTRFLMLRAQFYQRQKNSELAWADYRQALKQAPKSAEVVLANLWFLIDGQRVELLPALMREYGAQAAADLAFWQAFAAASQALERHREAVFWYAKAAAQNPSDPLMLLNYADALDRTDQHGMADRMRRHAWLQLKQKYPQAQPAQATMQSSELLALARLRLMDQPGDAGQALVRQWVSQMRGLPDAPATEQTAVLVLGWAIVKEQFNNARAWMWSRYARQSQLAPPLWGDSQTALQLHETQTLDRLLTRHGEALPIYNRYDTAYALGHVQQAVDIAFKGMSQQDDEPLYDRYRQHLLGQANYVQLGLGVAHQGGLNSHDLRFENRLVINPKLHLILSGSRQQQTGADPLLQALTTATDRLASVQARWLGERGDTSLTIARRDELNGLMSFRLQQSVQLGGRLNLEGGVDFRTESTVSLPMQVAGYENSVYGAANYTLGKREYFRIAPRYSRYFTQFGDELGSGRMLDMEFGYRIRTEYPDWRLRAFLTRQLFSRPSSYSQGLAARLPADFVNAVIRDLNPADQDAYFIPDSSTTWGACWGMGENLAGQNLQTTYARAWRPFFDLCLNHNTLNGFGLNRIFGLAGSVTGEDHLLLQLQNSDGTQPGSSPTNSLAVRYRRYF
jgi:predicted Zn-dependent protease